jgi:NADH:ubiquinone oxidoreductase subunit 6 (subunit J)
MYGELNMNKLLLTMAKFIPAVKLANDKTPVTNANEKSVTDISQVAQMFKALMKYVLGPVLSIIGVGAVIYLIMLGINYAKAEDADGRKKVQGRLIGAAVGAVIIIAGAVLCFALPWDSIFAGFAENAGVSDELLGADK